MPTNMTFAKVQAYLNAIADNPNNTMSINGSPHGRFWNVSYELFTTGNVPGGDLVQCNNAPIPIIDRNHPEQSPFFLILSSAAGFCNISQMPLGGPYITDADYQVTLADGEVVTGQQIAADLFSWLTNHYPKG